MINAEHVTIVTPADFMAGPPQGFWTYDDYAALPDDGRRYEIMDGVLLMAPAPTPEHQNLVVAFSAYLVQHVNMAGRGKVLVSPIDVELAPNRVFQPDVLVVLQENLHKIRSKKVMGAPDLIVEIASPGTAAYDRLSKSLAYAEAGVKEYWIANPAAQTIEVFALQGSYYQSQGLFKGEHTLPSRVVPEISGVQVQQFFNF